MANPCPSQEKFQIGWICALPIEAAAAKEMLDENYGMLEDQDPADTNSYTLGRIGKHNIVIACLPGGQYGTTAATTVANNMTRTFSKSLRIGLMVGIGGGIPSDSHDIRLGDIVISYPEGSCGGVVQYDIGKVGEGGTLQRKGYLNSPPRSLLTAVSSMRAAELTDDPEYLTYLKSAIGRTARTRKTFRRPDSQTDRLFDAGYEHPLTASTCDGCSAELEVTREEREENDPQTHYGIIASGNSVMKHGATRERLGQETGALCFEMEAAGLMLDFPCIVIRGISDYADCHKDKQWQGYAALAAASYAKELLGYVPRGQISQEKLVTDVCASLAEISGELSNINQGLHRAFTQQEYHYQEQTARAWSIQQQTCHQTFKTSTYEQYKDINPCRAEGTCQWALKSSQYLRWWQNDCNDLLWISADPGCGKSVLAKSLIDQEFRASESISICYFFFKDNDEQNNLSTVLCAILHQLFGQNPTLLQHAMPSWEKNGPKIQLEVGELWRIFMAATSDPASPRTICVFDALDECRDEDRNRLIQNLKDFYRQYHTSTPNTWLKFLVTSRPYPELQNSFQAITDSFPHIHLQGEEENDQIHQEIDLVVRTRVAELAKSASLSAEIQNQLEQHLLNMHHRTYLWLYLAINDIQTTFQTSLRPNEESIRLIPISVNAAYKKILAKVSIDQVHTVRRILQIIVSARRPLTTEEMAMALGVALSPHLRTAEKATLDPKVLGRKIRQLCGLFVFISNSKIYLIHQTARDFLVQEQNAEDSKFPFYFDLVLAETQMAQICIRYLTMDDLEDSQAEENFIVTSLLSYSAEHWPDHVRNRSSAFDPDVEALLYQLYDTTTTRFNMWHLLFWNAVMQFRERPKMNAIHLAAFNGHINVVRNLISKSKDNINEVDSTKTTALMWASENGHHEVIETLLENGADVTIHGGYYGTALQAASYNGHGKVIQMLLDRGADINIKEGYFGSALQAASFNGHEKTAEMLLDNGADISSQGESFGDALQAASSNGHTKVVQVLLDRGADIDAEGMKYGHALQAASYNGQNKVVQMLLDRGADIKAQKGQYGNALQAASYKGQEQVVRILLDRGADVNAQGGHFANAIKAASYSGHEKVVEMLLANGADISAQGRRYGDALQAAAYNGKEKVVQMLLDCGADVNAQGGDFGNALRAASCNNHEKVMQILLGAGADSADIPQREEP